MVSEAAMGPAPAGRTVDFPGPHRLRSRRIVFLRTVQKKEALSLLSAACVLLEGQ